MIMLSSVNNNKFHIPGQTKEIEAIRRKAIINGLIVAVDIIMQVGKNEEISKKIKAEILENLDSNDYRLHLYIIFQHF